MRKPTDLPDASNHAPQAAHAARLMERTGLTLPELSERLGVAVRTLRCYKDPGPSNSPLPYTVQYCLEALALGREHEHERAASTARRNGGSQARRH